MFNLLRLRAEHEAWHMVTLDHIFGSRVGWKRVWVTADVASRPGGAVEATIGKDGLTRSLSEAVDDLDAETRQGLYIVFRAARWGTAKKYGEETADEHAHGDLATERTLAVSEEAAHAAIRALDAANLDARVQCVAGMLEQQLDFNSADCREALRTSKLSPEDRAAERQQVLDSLARLIRAGEESLPFDR